MGREKNGEIKEQTAELFRQYREATDEPTKISLENDIIQANFNLALHKSKKFCHTTIDDEDIVAAAIAGLFLAVRSYDHTKAEFATYAGYVIDNEIAMLFRKAGYKKRSAPPPISLDAHAWMDRLIDDGVQIETKVVNTHLFQELIAICEKILDELECAVLKNYLLPNGARKSRRELGEQLSRGEYAVKRAEKRAVKKLRDYIVEQGWGLELLRG